MGGRLPQQPSGLRLASHPGLLLHLPQRQDAGGGLLGGEPFGGFELELALEPGAGPRWLGREEEPLEAVGPAEFRHYTPASTFALAARTMSSFTAWTPKFAAYSRAQEQIALTVMTSGLTPICVTFLPTP